MILTTKLSVFLLASIALSIVGAYGATRLKPSFTFWKVYLAYWLWTSVFCLLQAGIGE